MTPAALPARMNALKTPSTRPRESSGVRSMTSAVSAG